jgi:hypothetical protein
MIDHLAERWRHVLMTLVVNLPVARVTRRPPYASPVLIMFSALIDSHAPTARHRLCVPTDLACQRVKDCKSTNDSPMRLNSLDRLTSGQKGVTTMNLNNQPTIDQLARLFAARKDSLDNHILWVCEEGNVHMDGLGACTEEQQFESQHPHMRARLKMYRKGHGYVGKKAAADKQFLGQVLETLSSEWGAVQQQPGLKVIDKLC